MFERTGLCYIKNVPQQLPKGGLCTIASMRNRRIKSRELTASLFDDADRSSFEHGTVRPRMVRSAALSYSP